MPKPTQADRQVVRFEDGELWCADDAIPPVSPAGWYARPRGTAAAPWIGPFPTAEAAWTAAVGRGDPFAAARRRLDEWLRAETKPGREAAAEAARAEDAARVPSAKPPAPRQRGGLVPAATPSDTTHTPTPQVRDPLPREPGPIVTAKPEQEPEPVPQPPAASSASRQLAFSFGQGGEAVAGNKGGTRVLHRKRRSERPNRTSDMQAVLPF